MFTYFKALKNAVDDSSLQNEKKKENLNEILNSKINK